jgi:hypothetical protein
VGNVPSPVQSHLPRRGQVSLDRILAIRYFSPPYSSSLVTNPQ